MSDQLDPSSIEMNAPGGNPVLMSLCADEVAAVVSFPLNRLPDELLLHVVAQVPKVDLHNLSLAANHIGSMAQEALHRCLTISYTNDAMPRQIPRLARTLFSRADLARAVAPLPLRPIIRLVEIPFTTPSAADDPVLQAFFQHTRVCMGETRVEELELNLSEEVFLGDNQRYKDLPKLFQRMFILQPHTINMSNKCLAPGPNQIEANILRDDARGNTEILIETMGAVSQTLEVLCIKEAGTDPDYFKYLEPVISLVHFNQMKYLQIPIEGILEQNLASRKRIGDLLSDRLKKLRLSGLSLEAMKGLEGVSSEDASLAFLALLGQQKRNRPAVYLWET